MSRWKRHHLGQLMAFGWINECCVVFTDGDLKTDGFSTESCRAMVSLLDVSCPQVLLPQLQQTAFGSSAQHLRLK